MRQRNEHELALQYYQMALQESPKFLMPKNLGSTYHKLDDYANAIVSFSEALKLRPNDIDVLNALASVYNGENRQNDAMLTYQQIVKLKPEHKQSWNNMGNIHLANKKFNDAIECYETALSIDPKYSDALNNLGNATKEIGYLDEALYYYEQAIDAPNARVELYSNYGVALKNQSFYEKALTALNQAIEKSQTDYPDAHWNKALVYLAMRNFERGWKEYEWRWQATNFDSTYITTSKPSWNKKKGKGSNLAGTRYWRPDYVFNDV